MNTRGGWLRKLLCAALVIGLAKATAVHSAVVFTHPDYVFSVDESGRAAHLQVSAAEYARWTNATPTSADRTNLTHRVYAHLRDTFDFIFVINVEEESFSGTYGRSYPARNSVSGIGRSLFDNTAVYGSTGVLQSLVHMTERRGLVYGPSLHEILHQWANYLTSVPTSNESHWGYSSVGGQLGGWQHGTLVHLGGTQYDADGPGGVTYWYTNANGGNAVPYADVELYLMGLMPTNGVTNAIFIAEGFNWVNFAQGQFSATNLKTVTIGNIVAGDGPRVPPHGAAQTNFRAAVVAISTGPLSSAHWADFAADVTSFSTNGSDGDATIYNFWEATRGLGRMKMDGLLSLLRPGYEFIRVSETQLLRIVTYRGDPPPPSHVIYTLTNTFAAPLAWTAQVSAAWLTAAPASGILGVGGSTQVIVSTSAQVTNAAGGFYTGSVQFVNTSNGAATVRSVRLDVHDFATPPFSDGFESGALSPYWIATGTGEWRIVISATNSVPHAGVYHLCLDDYAGASGSYFSRNEATLGLDLDGYTNVILTFWVQNLQDEPHGPPPAPFVGGADFDGVAISADGTHWYEVHPLRFLPATNAYIQRMVDIDAAAAARGLTYNRHFRIRFNQFDNYPIGLGDGITIDDVSITATLMDADADGMPDRYERQHGFDPSNGADAAEDPDLDGLSNLEEYLADTLPLIPSSVFQISTFTFAGDVVARFDSSSRRHYTLLSRDQFGSGGWISVPGMTNLPGVGGVMEMRDTNVAATATRFYSVQCVNP